MAKGCLRIFLKVFALVNGFIFIQRFPKPALWRCQPSGTGSWGTPVR